MPATPQSPNAEAEPARTTAVWVGGLSPRDCVRAIRELTQQVLQWHAVDRLHRAIQLDDLHWPRETEHPVLQAPIEEAIEFGGPFANPDLCPPELRGSRTVSMPADLSEAQRALTEHGALFQPSRIDVYQLGTLLCRLISGKSIRTYLSSPATMSRVPKLARTVIDRCVGYDESNRIETAAELAQLLDVVLQAKELATDASIESLKDTAFAVDAPTRVTRRVPPFQTLGHFDVLEEIGHGGMGVVYRGFDRSLDRAVALKVLHPRFANDASFVQRFKAEAAAAGKLNHPHLVPIYFIGEESGRHFFAMQFVNGESLAERLHRVGRLSRDEVLAIIQQVLLGLAAAHKQGFVHRDIKPGNILLDRDNGSALLTDFGLACGPITDEAHESQMVMGTAEYMSPEQAQGLRIDRRSDLYSVGVVLYQLLSGQTPFAAHTPSSQMIQHVCEQPQPLSQIAPEVDWQLVRIVDRLLRKRPEERYQSVEEVLIDVQQLPGQQPAIAFGSPSSPQLNAASRPAGRKSYQRWLIGLTVLLLTIGLWLARPTTTARSTAVTIHTDSVWALTFSADGSRLVSGGGRSTSLKEAGDTALRLWDTNSGQLLKQSEPLPIGPERLVFLGPSQRVIALASAREGTGTLVTWDMSSGKQEAPRFADPFAFHFDAAVSGPLSVFAVGNQGLTELSWEANTRSMTQRTRQSGSGPYRTIATAHDSKVATVFVSMPSVDAERPGDEVLKLTGPQLKVERRWRVDGTIHSLATSASGTVFVTRHTRMDTTQADVVTIWDAQAEQPLWSKSGLESARPGIGLSSDGRRLISIGEAVSLHATSSRPNSSEQAAIVWDIPSQQELCRLKTGSAQLRAVAITANGTIAALGDEQGRVVLSRLPSEPIAPRPMTNDQ